MKPAADPYNELPGHSLARSRSCSPKTRAAGVFKGSSLQTMSATTPSNPK